jgi:hypothetical protein
MSTKVSALTQATNAEITDATLTYLVVDPSGTPASKKSTLARIGTLKDSWVDDAGDLVTWGVGGGNSTTGHYFLSNRSGQTCTGVRVYWAGTAVRTLKLTLWEDGVGTELASATVTTTTTPGIYTATFGSAVALNRKKAYCATCYETSGTETNVVQPMLSVAGTYWLAPWYAGGARYRDFMIITWAAYASGDALPGSTQGGYVYPVEPMVSG